MSKFPAISRDGSGATHRPSSWQPTGTKHPNTFDGSRAIALDAHDVDANEGLLCHVGYCYYSNYKRPAGRVVHPFVKPKKARPSALVNNNSKFTQFGGSVIRTKVVFQGRSNINTQIPLNGPHHISTPTDHSTNAIDGFQNLGSLRSDIKYAGLTQLGVEPSSEREPQESIFRRGASAANEKLILEADTYGRKTTSVRKLGQSQDHQKVKPIKQMLTSSP